MKYNDESICFHVTTISAGHCPGSVMLLFETKSGQTLYTGDFRIQEQDIKQISIFKEFSEKNNLNLIYLDSTFLRKEYKDFPSQSESVAEIIRLTQEWLQINKNKKVYYTFPARYGYEALLIAVSKYFKQKMKVFEEIYENYKYISKLENCVTISNSSEFQIHVIQSRFCGNLAKTNIDLENVRIIKPSAMYWRHWKEGNLISTPSKEHKNILRFVFNSLKLSFY